MYQRAKQTGGGSGKAGDQTKGRVLLLKDAHYICYVVKAAKEKKTLYIIISASHCRGCLIQWHYIHTLTQACLFDHWHCIRASSETKPHAKMLF